MNEEDKRRYSRNLMLDSIGAEGEEKLLRSSVLIVGCGALGSIAALYLAGSGVGRLGLVDFDTIDVSNLQRQIAFSEKDAGQKKTDLLAKRIKELNGNVIVEPHNIFLSKNNAKELLVDYDVIIEGSDNPETKYLVSDMCNSMKKPCVIAGVSGWQAQVTTYLPEAKSYRDIFPNPHSSGGYTPCSLGGVLGPLPGIVGSIQASETIKLITGAGELLVNKLLTIDALTISFRTLRI